jgi:hypothetical protein
MTTVTDHVHGHGHGHGHERGHDHKHDHEPGTIAPAPNASVALDIGPGRGALVIYPDERFRGREIEISRTDGNGRRVHTGVHEREAHRGGILTAIFGSLPAGEYAVWEDADTCVGSAAVPEGSVAEFHLD